MSDCLKPQQAWQRPDGKVVFKLPPISAYLDRLPDGWRELAIPCGRCYSCQKNRAFEITVRAVAESRVHDYSSFVTLTVDDDFLGSVFPSGLCHRPWQLFAKRLRKAIGSFRFLMCGEYGSRTMRPHYHAIIFGHKFVDCSLYIDGSFTSSKVLQECWPFGHVMVDVCNNNRIAYVAGYTMKDFPLGRDSNFWKGKGLGLPYVKWSRRPALGRSWFDRYFRDLLKGASMEFILNGRSVNIAGRYFFKLLDLKCPALCAILKSIRAEKLQSLDDLTRIMRHSDVLRSAAFNQHRAKTKQGVSEL